MHIDQEFCPRSHFPDGAFDVVAMTASRGGIQALSQVLSTLPSDFPVPIIIVQHLQPTYESKLAELLNRSTPLSVKWAESGDYLRAGTVYVAPPDHHLVVTEPGIITLSQAPKVQFVRPSANLLFESVAICYRERAIAVVLTGTGRDGAKGVQAIKRFGGRVLVQNMSTSKAFGMPSAALKTGCVDFALSLRAIPHALLTLVMVKGAAELFSVARVAHSSPPPLPHAS
jgi:two-component system chemotaxis response regulator CheB